MTPPFPIPDFAIDLFRRTGEVTLVWPVVPQPRGRRKMYRTDTGYWTSQSVTGQFGIWDDPVRPGDVLEALELVEATEPPWRKGKGIERKVLLPVAAVGAKQFSEVTVDEWLDTGVRTYGETWRATSCGIEQFLRDAADEWNEQRGHLGPEYLAAADPWVWMIRCKGGE
jgi:hypothetical protein